VKGGCEDEENDEAIARERLGGCLRGLEKMGMDVLRKGGRCEESPKTFYGNM